MATTTDAYLHVITGGFDVQKRKLVRRLFQGYAEENVGQHDNSDYDLIVGAIEEINSIGVKQFTMAHIMQIFEIFNVVHLLKTENTVEYIEHALALLGCGKSGNQFIIPDHNKIGHIRRQYCSDTRRDERLKSLNVQSKS